MGEKMTDARVFVVFHHDSYEGCGEFRREHAAEMDTGSRGYRLRRRTMKAKQDV